MSMFVITDFTSMTDHLILIVHVLCAGYRLLRRWGVSDPLVQGNRGISEAWERLGYHKRNPLLVRYGWCLGFNLLCSIHLNECQTLEICHLPATDYFFPAVQVQLIEHNKTLPHTAFHSQTLFAKSITLYFRLNQLRSCWIIPPPQDKWKSKLLNDFLVIH